MSNTSGEQQNEIEMQSRTPRSPVHESTGVEEELEPRRLSRKMSKLDIGSTAKENSRVSMGNDFTDLRSATDNASVGVAESISDVSEDELRMKATGLKGIIERVPIGLKLFIMSLACVAGMAIISIYFLVYRVVDTANVIKQEEYLTLLTQVRSISQRSQEERRLCRQYLATKSAERKKTLQEYQNNSTLWWQLDALEKKVDAQVARDSRFIAAHDSLTNYLITLPDFRKQVIAANITGLDAFKYMAAMSVVSIDFFTTYTTTHFSSKEITQSLFFLRLRESQGQIFGFTQQAPLDQVSSKKELNYLIANRDYDMLMVKNIASQEMLKEFQDKLAASTYSKVLEYEGNVTATNPNSTFSTTSMTTPYQDLLAVLDYFVDKATLAVIASQSYDKSNAIFSIVFACAIFVVVVAASFFINAVVSSTITGPWKRLNMLQELMVNKFVPKEYLALMGCNKITDVKLGKYKVRENLLILRFAIHDVQVLMNGMTHEQKIAFINHHLNFFAAVVTSFRGYVDRYHQDGFVALFLRPKNAVQCLLELNRCVDVYNTKVTNMSKPTITASICMHRAERILVGAIGESDRVQGCIVSDDYLLVQQMIAQARKYQVSMLVTDELRKEFGRVGKFRMLGTVVRTTGESDDFYEVLQFNSAQYKIKTHKEFSDGVKLMLSGNYSLAAVKFDIVLKESKGFDAPSKRMLELCRNCIEKTRAAIAAITPTETLKDSSLRAAFERFCVQERSQENITMWQHIEDFKSFSSESSRKLVAQKILTEYLLQQESMKINLPATVINTYKSKVEAALANASEGTNEQLMNVDFFKELQAEVLFVMNDSHVRFTKTEPFQNAFSKSKYAVALENLAVYL